MKFIDDQIIRQLELRMLSEALYYDSSCIEMACAIQAHDQDKSDSADAMDKADVRELRTTDAGDKEHATGGGDRSEEMGED